MVGEPSKSPERRSPKEDAKAAKPPRSESNKCMQSARQISSADNNLQTDEKRRSSPQRKKHPVDRSPTAVVRDRKEHEATDKNRKDRKRRSASRAPSRMADKKRSSEKGSSPKKVKVRAATSPTPKAGRTKAHRRSKRREEGNDRRQDETATSTHRNDERRSRKDKRDDQSRGMTRRSEDKTQ